jgi:hypothetical protein
LHRRSGLVRYASAFVVREDAIGRLEQRELRHIQFSHAPQRPNPDVHGASDLNSDDPAGTECNRKPLCETAALAKAQLNWPASQIMRIGRPGACDRIGSVMAGFERSS